MALSVVIYARSAHTPHDCPIALAHTMLEQGAAWMIFLGVRLHISYAYFISSRDQRCFRQGSVVWVSLGFTCWLHVRLLPLIQLMRVVLRVFVVQLIIAGLEEVKNCAASS